LLWTNAAQVPLMHLTSIAKRTVDHGYVQAHMAQQVESDRMPHGEDGFPYPFVLAHGAFPEGCQDSRNGCSSSSGAFLLKLLNY